MKKKLWIAAGLWLGMAAIAFARGPKDKLSEPVFEDPTNNAAVYATTVGSFTAVKIYMPDVKRDVRKVRITNHSQYGVLHISTWSLTITSQPANVPSTVVNTTITCNTWPLQVSTSPWWNTLDLNANTTWYGIYEVGVPSAVVRALEFYDDPSKRP